MPGIDISVDSYSRLFGVMGERLGDDWAPIIHNSLFAARQDGAVFLPLRLPRDQVSELMALCGSVLEGICVAEPYHEIAAAMMDKRIDAAAMLDMVDTVAIARNGDRVGHLVLPEAIDDALREGWVQVDEKRALVRGEGCFAACAAYTLLKNGAEVTMAVNDMARAGEIKRMLGEACGYTPDIITTGDLDDMREIFEVLVNGTTLGSGRNGSEQPFRDELVENCEVAIDCVSSPIDTAFLDAAARAGAKTVCGFDIKLNAAALSQSAWGFKALKRPVRTDVFKQLRACARNAK